MNNRKWFGFTFLEMLIVVFILLILSLLSYPIYKKYIRNARFNEAKLALAENVQFMMRYYSNYLSYKDFSQKEVKWPDLPRKETHYFKIDFTSNAKYEANDRFRLRAKPKPFYEAEEPRYLEVDYNMKIKFCELQNRRNICESM